MPTERHAFVNGVDNGEVFKSKGRWCWHRGYFSVETYSRGSTLDDVKEHIGRVCRSTNVEFRNVSVTPDQHGG